MNAHLTTTLAGRSFLMPPRQFFPRYLCANVWTPRKLKRRLEVKISGFIFFSRIIGEYAEKNDIIVVVQRYELSYCCSEGNIRLYIYTTRRTS
jgi:hypothetical protein